MKSDVAHLVSREGEAIGEAKREGEAPAEPKGEAKREGGAPAEPLAFTQRLPWPFNPHIWRNPTMNYDMHPRLGRSLALPSCDQLKDELFHALEGSTR